MVILAAIPLFLNAAQHENLIRKDSVTRIRLT